VKRLLAALIGGVLAYFLLARRRESSSTAAEPEMDQGQTTTHAKSEPLRPYDVGAQPQSTRERTVTEPFQTPLLPKGPAWPAEMQNPTDPTELPDQPAKKGKKRRG